MGYDVYITRGTDWFENNDVQISLEEWLAYVKSDPEMRIDNKAEAQTSDGILRYENIGLAVWTSYTRHDEAGNMAWFDFQNGNIVVKNPDKEILTKMCRIAESLQARVQGDEGESYPEALSRSTSTDPAPMTKIKSWWKKVIGR
jgi:hypothetical protein